MNDVGAGNAIKLASNLPECKNTTNPLQCATASLGLDSPSTYQVMGIPVPVSAPNSENVAPPMQYNQEEDDWECIGTLTDDGKCLPKVEESPVIKGYDGVNHKVGDRYYNSGSLYVVCDNGNSVLNSVGCDAAAIAAQKAEAEALAKAQKEEDKEKEAGFKYTGKDGAKHEVGDAYFVLSTGKAYKMCSGGTSVLVGQSCPGFEPSYCTNYPNAYGCPGYNPVADKTEKKDKPENLVGTAQDGTILIDGISYFPSDLGFTYNEIKTCTETNSCPVVIDKMDVLDVIRSHCKYEEACEEFKESLKNNEALRAMVEDYKEARAATLDKIPEEKEGVDYVSDEEVAGFYKVSRQNWLEVYNPNNDSELASIEEKLEKENPGYDYKWLKNEGDLTPQLIYITDQDVVAEIEEIEEVLPTEEEIQSYQQLNKMNSKSNLVSAAESETNKIIYFPEFGMYNVEIDGFEIDNIVVDGNLIVLFYMEVNGIAGIQPPVNKENPQPGEDIIINSSSFEINYSKEASSTALSLKKGINIVAFNYIPAPLTDEDNFTAKSLIKLAQPNGIRIEYITFFESGRWVDGIKCNESECFGEDFVIAPGRGYLIKSSKADSFQVPMYELLDPIPLPLSIGWNLIGVHGYADTFTARSFIDSVNSIDTIQADNVTNYSTAKSKYEGLQVIEEMEYGFDFELDPNIGYFVRINKFEPENADCKSIIWHPDGELHGKCGNIRNLFNL